LPSAAAGAASPDLFPFACQAGPIAGGHDQTFAPQVAPDPVIEPIFLRIGKTGLNRGRGASFHFALALMGVEERATIGGVLMDGTISFE
jgi:hypothetical protein